MLFIKREWEHVLSNKKIKIKNPSLSNNHPHQQGKGRKTQNCNITMFKDPHKILNLSLLTSHLFFLLVPPIKHAFPETKSWYFYQSKNSDIFYSFLNYTVKVCNCLSFCSFFFLACSHLVEVIIKTIHINIINNEGKLYSWHSVNWQKNNPIYSNNHLFIIIQNTWTKFEMIWNGETQVSDVPGTLKLDLRSHVSLDIY